MSDDFKYQASYRFGAPDSRGNPQDMLNVRANTPEEFENALRAIYSGTIAGTMVLVGDTIRGDGVVGQPVGSGMGAQNNPVGAQIPPTQSQGPPPDWAQPQQPAPMTPTCAHGVPREYRSGNKNGKSWAGWFCAHKGAGQCAVEWVETK